MFSNYDMGIVHKKREDDDSEANGTHLDARHVGAFKESRPNSPK